MDNGNETIERARNSYRDACEATETAIDELTKRVNEAIKLAKQIADLPTAHPGVAEACRALTARLEDDAKRLAAVKQRAQPPSPTFMRTPIG